MTGYVRDKQQKQRAVVFYSDNTQMDMILSDGHGPRVRLKDCSSFDDDYQARIKDIAAHILRTTDIEYKEFSE